MYTQTNALTGKNCTRDAKMESLTFIVPELTIEELSVASAATDEPKLLTYG